MDAGFIQWLADKRGFRPGDTIATKQQYDAMYKQYLSDSGSGWQPTSVPVTNAVTQEVVSALMTSPNSATLMAEKQPQFKPAIGEDGKAYNFNPMTGEYSPATIKGTTNQFKPAKKQPAALELLGQMNVGQTQDTSPTLWSRIFGGVSDSPPPSTAMPVATPSTTPEATPAPATAATNAPTKMVLRTPEEVRAAWQAGKLSDADAVRMLRGK